MGLDHWLYKAKKPTHEQLALTEKRLAQNALAELTLLEHSDDNHELLENIIGTVATTATVWSTTFDWELFEADHDIPDGARLMRISNDPQYNPYRNDIVDEVITTFGYRYKGEDYTEPLHEFSYTRYDTDHRYTVLTCAPDNYVVSEMTELAQWRKRYDIQETVYNLMADADVMIENCGYYVLTDECVDAIKKLDPEIADVICNADERFVYHEWY